MRFGWYTWCRLSRAFERLPKTFCNPRAKAEPAPSGHTLTRGHIKIKYSTLFYSSIPCLFFPCAFPPHGG